MEVRSAVGPEGGVKETWHGFSTRGACTHALSGGTPPQEALARRHRCGGWNIPFRISGTCAAARVPCPPSMDAREYARPRVANPCYEILTLPSPLSTGGRI